MKECGPKQLTVSGQSRERCRFGPLFHLFEFWHESIRNTSFAGCLACQSNTSWEIEIQSSSGINEYRPEGQTQALVVQSTAYVASRVEKNSRTLSR